MPAIIYVTPQLIPTRTVGFDCTKKGEGICI
jgi:hypothetical protein